MAWNQRKEEQQPVRAKGAGASKGLLRGLVAGAVVCLGAVVCWLFLKPAEPAREGIKAPKKAIADRASKSAARPAATNRVESARDRKESAAEKAKREYVKKPGQMQLPDGQVLTFPPPKEGEVRKVVAYGHIYECDHLGNFKDVTVRPLFDTAFEENFLGLAVADKPFIPAFLTGLDEDAVKKMLAKNYQLKGDETETEIARLKAYDDMRCSALQYMEEGGRFDDFVNEYAKFDRLQRQAKATSLREVMTLYREGRVAEAKEMAKAANILMEKKGYRPIRFPDYAQKAFDAIPDQQN